MISAQNWFRTHRNRSGSISLPDMAPFVSVTFIISCLFLAVGRPKSLELGIVSDDKVPHSMTHACIPENTEIVISLSAKNRLSFAITIPEIQVASIQEVAAQHGVEFTPYQLAELKTLSFLRTNVENLPYFLSLPAYNRNTAVELDKLAPLSEQQLIECVVAARASAMNLTRKSVSTSLKIDSEVKGVYFGHLFDLLQAQDIKRFLLLTQY